MILGWLILLPTLGKTRGAGGMPAGVFLLFGNEFASNLGTSTSNWGISFIIFLSISLWSFLRVLYRIFRNILECEFAILRSFYREYICGKQHLILMANWYLCHNFGWWFTLVPVLLWFMVNLSTPKSTKKSYPALFWLLGHINA